MALNSLIRRATSTVVPLAIRAARSSRNIHSSVLRDSKLIGSGVGRGSFSQSVRFYAAPAKKQSSDESLIRVLESEIECANSEGPTVDEILEEKPAGFPFEIEDNTGERTITLRRQYGDENIEVIIDMPTPEGVGEGEDGSDANEDEDVQTSIPLVVKVSRGNAPFLEFGVAAYPDEFAIDSLSIKQTEASEDELAYEGPDFHDLDENLQKAFHKYLEIRGIKPSTTNFLISYMQNKDIREYSQWLKNLKDFIEN